jgi:hypothetical protein
MRGKFVQHRIYDNEDMMQHHRSVVEEETYFRQEYLMDNYQRDKALNSTFRQTGYAANCSSSSTSSEIGGEDEGDYVVVSCHKVYYRINIQHFINNKNSSNNSTHNNNNNHNDFPQVIVGILSHAYGLQGEQRRQTIRETWASNHNGIYFIVAGPWETVEREFNHYGDLIWIDQSKIDDDEYDEGLHGYDSVSPYKTLSFMSIIHKLSKEYDLEYSYMFKTDDDSYVNLNALHDELFQTKYGPFDYLGKCKGYHKTTRVESSTSYLSHDIYPEPYLPPKCFGFGYATSQRFIHRAVTEHHIQSMRYIPLEDEAVGILAERMGITPEINEYYHNYFVNYRVGHQVEKDGLKTLSLIHRNRLPRADMRGKFVQNHIYDDMDMRDHHKSVVLWCT